MEPAYIGKVRTRNRMMKNGAHLFYDTKANGGHMNDRNIAFYETLAKGGVGLIVATSGLSLMAMFQGFVLTVMNISLVLQIGRCYP
jgi:2,4-dienoyl-CoA reductase-like NADH-dependent reductase (Old Yellow Enzyme family)